MKNHFVMYATAVLLYVGCSACACALAEAPAAPAAATETAAVQPVKDANSYEYKIGAGNILRVDVYNGKGEKISEIVRVASDGGISLPFVGDLIAAGMTVPELQKELKQRLVKNDFVSSNVLVFVEEFSTVTIVGEVRRSGTYAIKGRMTILELIAMAEGLTDFASSDAIKVVHLHPDGAKASDVVRLYDVMNNTATDSEGFLLTPGDVVIVPRSVVSIMGEVNNTGIYPTRGRLTVTELIAIAGGFSKFASANDVKVTHSNPDGTKTRRVIRVKDIVNKGSGDNENLLLQPGDLVYVPASMY
ncbi:MAG: polysaccharide export protein [Candidatus Omnitrophica bacterium]|nr:polysaccharide export protein [Candidatus Omnitrophota bacterium]